MNITQDDIIAMSLINARLMQEAQRQEARAAALEVQNAELRKQLEATEQAGRKPSA